MKEGRQKFKAIDSVKKKNERIKNEQRNVSWKGEDLLDIETRRRVEVS